MHDVAKTRHARMLPRERGEPFGRYTLLGRVGSGGMADVYAAELVAAAGFRKRVAIKRMNPQLMADEAAVGMFLEEARLGSRLSHAKICEVYELSQVDGEYFIAMEYMHGVPLSTLITACRRARLSIPIPVVLSIIVQACEGLHYAHQRKDAHGNSLCVIHRDVSPQNLFVCDDGTVKVLDFGIAKTDDSGHLTATGTLKGKDSYMSPEQLQGKRLDCRSDVWSLGVVLFEVLTGVRLFKRGSMMETVHAIGNQPIPRLSVHCPQASPALADVVARALCRERDWRFSSAEQLRQALLDAAGSDGVAPLESIGSLVREACADALAERERMFDDAGPVAARGSQREESGQCSVGSGARPSARKLSLPPQLSLESGDEVPEPVTARVESSPRVRLDDTDLKALKRRARLLRGALIATSLAFISTLILVLLTARSMSTPRVASMASQPAPPALSPRPEQETPQILAQQLAEPIVREAEPALEVITAAPEAQPTPGRTRWPAAEMPRLVKAKTRDLARRKAAPVESAAPAALFVVAVPYATIYIDDTKVGVTPVLGAPVSPGRHTVRAVTADGRSKTFKIHLDPGEAFRQRIQW